MIELIQDIPLLEFSTIQLILTCLVFIWSGFVRSGLGFGGAALGLPLMLLIYDKPLFWLPIVATHLLIFTTWTLRSRLSNVDWGYLRQSLYFLMPGKLIGVFGLISLPNDLLVLIIYSITLSYALMWLFKFTLKSAGGWGDKFLLLLGGYVSGTSLTGAPLVVAVYLNHVKRTQLRDTLFLLWIILVTIKMSTLALFNIDLQTASALILIPVAWIGHVIGLKAHDYLLNNDKRFKPIIGGVLVMICLIGLIS